MRLGTLRGVQRVTTSLRHRGCGRWAATSDQSDRPDMLPVRVNVTEDGALRAGIGNLQSCASWWCPRCGPKIARERAGETEHMLRVWGALGYAADLLTVTVWHHRGHRLADLLGAMRGAWSATWNGKAGMGLRRKIRMQYRIRVIEITEGDEHGWHPHFHVLILRSEAQQFRPTEEGKAAARDWYRPVWARWVRALRRRGYDALDEVNGESAGFDVTPVDLASDEEIRRMAAYVEKGAGNMGTRRVLAAKPPAWSAAIELHGAVWKQGGRAGLAADQPERGSRHRSLAQVFEDYAVESRPEDEALVREALDALHGLRQRDPSKGMRAAFAQMAEALGIPGPLLVEERTDEEVAAADDVEDSTTVGWISARAWAGWLYVEGHDMRAAARLGGLAALVEWFDRRDAGFEWTEAISRGAG